MSVPAQTALALICRDWYTFLYKRLNETFQRMFPNLLRFIIMTIDIFYRSQKTNVKLLLKTMFADLDNSLSDFSQMLSDFLTNVLKDNVNSRNVDQTFLKNRGLDQFWLTKRNHLEWHDFFG